LASWRPRVQIPPRPPDTALVERLSCPKSVDRWSKLEPETRGKLLKLFVALDGKKNERTVEDYLEALIRAAEALGSLDNVQRTADWLSRSKVKWIRKHGMAGFNHYVRIFKLPQPTYEFKRDPRRQLPRLPPEKTLKASIVVARRLKWQAYFRLLYECGPRPSEPFKVKVRDVYFEKQMIRLGTLKGSGYTAQRELPISPLLTEQLRTLTEGKGPDEWVFTKTTKPKEPLTYKQALDVMTAIRKQMRQAGYSTENLRLGIYRHAFGTRIYNATKDLALTARALGHRDIQDTMIYIHLRPEEPRRYDVECFSVKDKEAITLKIAEGWEIALQTPELVYFKRPRWVP